MADFASMLNQFKRNASSGSAGNSGGRKRTLPSSSIVSSNLTRQRSSSSTKSSSYPFPSSTPVRTIYIACPAFAETGGPEALHQLCHVINQGCYSLESGVRNESVACGGVSFGNEKQVRAFMLYLRETTGARSSSECEVEHVQSFRARPPKYDRYDAPPAECPPPSYCDELEFEIDREGEDEETNSSNGQAGLEKRSAKYSSNLVIWPECWTHLIDSLQPRDDGPSSRIHPNLRRYQAAIWWLSVDNNKGSFLPHFKTRKDVLHLAQSAYARNYVLGQMGQNVGHVLDMTEFIPYASSVATNHINSKDERDLDVVYNPVKGMHYTDEIIRRAWGKKTKVGALGTSNNSAHSMKFDPIGKGIGGQERMTEDEVVELLKRSKVYIDFGPHPGMDRLPREAALSGCIVVTNREGAANFVDDVPLPSEFKFKTFDVDSIYCLLKECCGYGSDKFEEYSKKMEAYREWIIGQQDRMKLCVDKLIEDVIISRRVVKNT